MARYLITEQATRTADNTTAGSHETIECRCPNGPDHVWSPLIFNLTAGKGCPFCANRNVSVTNSLATKRQDLAPLLHEDNELTPEKIIATSNCPCLWLCSCGHSYTRSPYDMARVGVGCNPCRRKLRHQKKRSERERQLDSGIDSALEDLERSLLKLNRTSSIADEVPDELRSPFHTPGDDSEIKSRPARFL